MPLQAEREAGRAVAQCHAQIAAFAAATLTARWLHSLHVKKCHVIHLLASSGSSLVGKLRGRAWSARMAPPGGAPTSGAGKPGSAAVTSGASAVARPSRTPAV